MSLASAAVALGAPLGRNEALLLPGSLGACTPALLEMLTAADDFLPSPFLFRLTRVGSAAHSQGFRWVQPGGSCQMLQRPYNLQALPEGWNRGSAPPSPRLLCSYLFDALSFQTKIVFISNNNNNNST